MADAALAHQRSGRVLHGATVIESHRLHVVGMDQLEEIAADDVVDLVAEDLPHGGRLEPHVTVGPGDADNVAGGLDQGLEALRALDLDGALLEVGPRQGQRYLRGQSSDRGGQLIRDRLGRLHDQHAPYRVFDAHARQENIPVAERAGPFESG